MIKKYFALLMITAFAYLPVCSQAPVDSNIDSLSKKFYNHNYLQPSALIIPGTFLLYSGLKPAINGIERIDNTIFTQIKKNDPAFHTNVEDYLMWAPSASVYLLDAFKIKTKNNFKEHLILDAGSMIITGGIGYGMRLVSRHIKVYTEEGTKFPSGHTANAFRGAEILHQELKDKNKLVSYSGYVVATTVGILRMYNKAHLLTDVLAGAGLGILSTKLTYWIFDKIKFRKK